MSDATFAVDLFDDGTLDTVVRVTCERCWHSWEARYNLDPPEDEAEDWDRVEEALDMAQNDAESEGCPLCDTPWTIARIREECRERGNPWFQPGTMKFFRSRIGRRVYQGPGGIYFTTSEQFGDNHPRLYSVRQFEPGRCRISKHGDFQGHGTESAARNAAKLAAQG